MTDTEGQMASTLLQNLRTGYKVGRGWEDRRWYLESKTIKSKLSVMGTLLRDCVALGVAVLAVMVAGWIWIRGEDH